MGDLTPANTLRHTLSTADLVHTMAAMRSLQHASTSTSVCCFEDRPLRSSVTAHAVATKPQVENTAGLARVGLMLILAASAPRICLSRRCPRHGLLSSMVPVHAVVQAPAPSFGAEHKLLSGQAPVTLLRPVDTASR